MQSKISKKSKSKIEPFKLIDRVQENALIGMVARNLETRSFGADKLEFVKESNFMDFCKQGGFNPKKFHLRQEDMYNEECYTWINKDQSAVFSTSRHPLQNEIEIGYAGYFGYTGEKDGAKKAKKWIQQNCTSDDGGDVIMSHKKRDYI